MRVKRLYVLVFALLFFSCSNEDEEKLKSIVSTDIIVDTNDSIEEHIDRLEQYQELELEFNSKYINDLENLVKTSFERQLEHFEDEELGFFAGYGYMFSYFFKSDQEWSDEMRLKSDKYFGALNIENEAYELFLSHTKDISNLRKRFWTRSKNGKLPQHQNLDLPDKLISLGDLTSHSRNNVFIEIVSEGLERLVSWLVYPLILWLLSLLIPNKTAHGCIAKIAAFLLCAIVSGAISMWNDNRLLDALRAQNNQEIPIDYNNILNELNKNTTAFYEKE